MEQKLTDIKKSLFKIFQQDHARLGEQLFRLRSALQIEDITGAQSLANEIDELSGAHIAFEEFEFYPALKKFLTEDEVFRMYVEHSDGLNLIENIKTWDVENPPTSEEFSTALEHLEIMEHHVADCGDLFGAMGGLEPAEYKTLYDKLMEWRRKAPKWRDINRNGVPVVTHEN